MPSKQLGIESGAEGKTMVEIKIWESSAYGVVFKTMELDNRGQQWLVTNFRFPQMTFCSLLLLIRVFV